MWSLDDALLLLSGGALAALLILVVGGLRLVRRRQGTAGTPTLAAPPVDQSPTDPDTIVQRLTIAFHTWLTEYEDRTDVWPAFDQLAREMLTDSLGATRVRCYHLRAGSETLQTLSQADNGAAVGPSAREGVLGHVATTGREYVAGDPAQGPLLEHLAAQNAETWSWAWPVRGPEGTVGIVAVGPLHDPTVLTRTVRKTVGQLLTLYWQHVACLEQLYTIRQTDQASGVLTRQDFLGLATRSLAESYAANEPVVVAVIVLEGLRRLDDEGCWQARDALIEQLGRIVLRRVRSDDLVGRFADDRFVILLRRLDSGLGRLIAEKLLSEANECLDGMEQIRDWARLRVGLAGSGLGRPALDALLAASFDAVTRARLDNVPIGTDLGQKPVEGG